MLDLKASKKELKIVVTKTLQDKTFKEMFSSDDYNKVVDLSKKLNESVYSDDTILSLIETDTGFIIEKVGE